MKRKERKERDREDKREQERKIGERELFLEKWGPTFSLIGLII